MADQDFAQRLKTGRNDECPCGSKKKYKKCHLQADETASAAALAKINAEAAANMKADAPADEHAGHAHDHPHKHEKGSPMRIPQTPVNRQVSAPRKTGSA